MPEKKQERIQWLSAQLRTVEHVMLPMPRTWVFRHAFAKRVGPRWLGRDEAYADVMHALLHQPVWIPHIIESIEIIPAEIELVNAA